MEQEPDLAKLRDLARQLAELDRKLAASNPPRPEPAAAKKSKSTDTETALKGVLPDDWLKGDY